MVTKIAKDGLIHLSTQAQDFHWTSELLGSGFFEKNQAGVYSIFLVYEDNVEYAYDNPEITPQPKIKKEKNVRVKKEPASAKKQSKDKKKNVRSKPLPTQTPSYEHKRAISQLSDVQETRSPEFQFNPGTPSTTTTETVPLDRSSPTPVTYELRSRR